MLAMAHAIAGLSASIKRVSFVVRSIVTSYLIFGAGML